MFNFQCNSLPNNCLLQVPLNFTKSIITCITRLILSLIYFQSLHVFYDDDKYVSVISCVWLCVPRAILSIYRGYIWHDGARSTVVSTITLRSGLHTRTTTRASPFWTSYGVCFVSYICKNDHDISREHDILFLFPSDNSCFQLMLFVCTLYL